MRRSEAEELLAFALKQRCAVQPVRELRFHPTRRWRFDFAWPDQKLAVEIDGRGRHQTVTGVRGDCEKHNEAVRLGWRVLRFPATDKGKVMLWVATIADCLRVVTSPKDALEAISC